jgi:hypothetical protein
VIHPSGYVRDESTHVEGDGAVARAGRGITFTVHAVATAVGVRGASITSAASSRALKVHRTIRVALAWSFDAVAGGADFPFFADGVVGARENACLAAIGTSAGSRRSADHRATVGLALVVRAARSDREANSARGVAPGRDAGAVFLAVAIPSTLVDAEGTGVPRVFEA